MGRREIGIGVFLSGVLAAALVLPAGCFRSPGSSTTTSSSQNCVGGCSYSTGCGTYSSQSTFNCSATFCCPPGATAGDGTNGCGCGSCC